MADYSAGRLLVSVVPDMRGVSTKVRKEFSGLGPYDVKVTATVDERGLDGLRAALRSLPDIKLDADSTAADREIVALRQRIMSLSEQQVGIDVSAADARREVDAIRGELNRLANESPDIHVRVDAGAAESALRDVSAELDRVSGRSANVTVTAETGQAMTRLRAIDRIRSGLDRARTAIRVTAEIGQAIGRLLTLQSLLAGFIHRRYTIRVSANTSAAAAAIVRMGLLVASLSTAISGLIGVAGGLAGALGGIGAAATVGAGGLVAAVLAFRGVGGAISALNEQQEQAGATAKASAQKQAQAAQQVQSAQESLSRAHQAAGQARRDAARQIATAERQLASAQRELRQAQSDLTDAWEEGRRSLQDLQDQLDSSRIDQRQAALDLRDAERALAEARASGNVEEIERAQIAYDRQRETVDQLGKRVQRLTADNAAGQRAGVAGTEAVTAAQERVRAATEGVGDAQRGVAEAREQAQQAIAAADQQVVEAQRALTQALAATRDTGTDAGDKVAQAFAKLSPAAAEFARYLFGLKPILDELSAIAAAGMFPPLIAGIDTLLTRLPEIKTVIGQLAAGTGAGLQLVLTQLASPFWTDFFLMLGNAAETIIPLLFGSIMTLARAAATLVTAFMPIAPEGLAILDMLSNLIAYLSPFLAQAFAAMFPAARAFIEALRPLGPLLVAAAPALNALGVALSQIFGALLTALTPILVALTPLIVAFAESLASGLTGALQTATPWLVSMAEWLSANPGLVMGVVGAIGTLLAVLRPLAFVASMVVSAFTTWAILKGASAILGMLGLQGTFAARAIMFLLSPISGIRIAMAGMSAAAAAAGGWFALLRTVIARIGMAILTALGPVGILIMLFGLLYASSEPFRAAINNLLGVFMTLIGTLVGAVMPIFTTLGQVLGMIGGVFAGLVTQLAGAFVPVINMLAGTLSSLVGAILPPLMGIVGALVPVIMLLGQAFAQVVSAVLGPLIGALGQLIGAVLPPLVFLLQNVVIPVITFLVGLFADVLSWVITNVLIPAIQFLVPILVGLAGVLSQAIGWVVTNIVVPALNMLVPIFQWIGAAAIWLWQNAIVPAWEAISTAILWAWTNVIKPVIDFIWLALRFLGAIVFVVLVAPFLIAFNLVSAAAVWLWENVLRPVFQAIGAFIAWVWTNLIKPALDALVWFWQYVLTPAAIWLWETIIKPTFQAIGDFIAWVWTSLIKPALDALVWFWENVLAPAAMWLWNEVIKPAWEGIGKIIDWVWVNVIEPAFNAVKDGLQWLGEKFDQVTTWIGDIWAKIKGYLAKPINFMIGTVWNEGVVPAWNKVADLVGIGKIEPLGLIPEARTGGRVDSRGMIHGPGSGTSDSILGRVKENDAPIRVSNREFIVNERATRANLPALTAMNGGATIGNAGNERRARRVPAFAGGGPVWRGLWNTVRGQFPNARLTDSTRPGANDYHGRGMAIDVAGSYPMAVGQMKEINQWIGRTFPGSTELIHYPLTGGGINLKNGGPHMYNPATQLSHSNHVHWAQDPANPRGGGNGGTVWGAISTFFTDAAREAFDTLTNPAIDALRKFVGPPPPVWHDVVPAMATKIRDAARDFVFGKAAEKDAQASAAGGGGMMGPVGDGEIFVIQQIADSARARGLGFDGAAIGVATGIVESGLRNLSYGDRDSVGVFQQRGNGAWGTLEQRMNVRHAADMFFNKLMSFNWRAMDPGAAAQKVQVSAFPARYGQEMGRARQLLAQHGGPFDNGGVARGKGLMFKDVIADERVLDPEQTGDYDTLARYADMIEAGRLVPARGLDARQLAAMTAGQGPGGREMHLHVHGDVNDPMDVDSLYNLIDFRERSASL